MSITTYAQLQSAVDNWLARTYAAARVQEFIALAEPVINRRIILEGGIRDMEASDTTALVAGTRVYALPTRYRAMRRLYLNTDPITKLDFMPPVDYWSKYASSTTGKPRVYTLEGDDVLYGPSPDSTYSARMLFYQAFAPLTDAASSNDLLTNNPDIYLQATLAQAWKFKGDKNEAARWDAELNESIQELILANKRDRFSGDILVQRADVGNPPSYTT